MLFLHPFKWSLDYFLYFVNIIYFLMLNQSHIPGVKPQFFYVYVCVCVYVVLSYLPLQISPSLFLTEPGFYMVSLSLACVALKVNKKSKPSGVTF